MSYTLSASPGTLRSRAAIIGRIRDFFAERQVLEVETPALSRAGVSDPAIESVAATLRGTDYYLHTSPEHAMKRLLAAGLGDSYQICRVFRDYELGRWHQPEFTLLEWYRVGWDENALMDEVDLLIRHAVGEAVRFKPSVRLSYAQAFERHLGIDAHGDLKELPDLLAERGIDVPKGLDRDALVDLALSQAVVAALKPDALAFIHDYPASQAALAQIKPQAPAVAARFEVFVQGIELANGFRELTDAAEQRRRFDAELEARRERGQPAPPLDEAFLAALEDGLPPCAGVAVGIDRLVALALGLDNVAEAMSFAHPQA